MSETIDQHAWKSWSKYINNTRSDAVKNATDSMTDEQYWACDDIYVAGFQAGVAWVLSNGKPNE